ncbi:helix-turn-helix domain-containing protein [Leeuwenhoekiella sp. NPDC079379]|uniref:helix-turn-helix domain-containing protein n=1 Tax=Leeuwenhoekiella sp. NPDC079379 TaxID=3364122 RepID=UPI0037CCAFE8
MLVLSLWILVSISGVPQQQAPDRQLSFQVDIHDLYYRKHLDALNINQLRAAYDEREVELHQQRLITEAYLNKARKAKDSFEIARAFDFAARLYDTQTNLKYSDSIILYSQNCYDYTYPALGYMLKGYYHYELGAYEESLKAYYNAYDLARLNQNKEQEIEISQVLGAFQNRWGDYTKAIEIYENHMDYLKTLPDFEAVYLEDYLITLHNLQLAYQRAGNYEQAAQFIEIGLEETLKTSDRLFFYDFLHSKGVNAYWLDAYPTAEKLLNEALSGISEDLSVVSVSYYYLGQIAKKIGDVSLANNYFKKIDSLYNLNKEVYPELKEVYIDLIIFSQNLPDSEEELYYTRRALAVDSVINSNKLYLKASYLNQVEKPRLLEELDSEKQAYKWRYMKQFLQFSLVALALVFSGIYLKSKFKRVKKFSCNASEPLKIMEIDDNDDPAEPVLTEEIKIVLLRRLQNFEDRQQYLDAELSLFSLAKDLNTNSAYLSRVINETKKMNFSSYINELRIEYLIKKLADDTQLQYYKIQALGEEVGFKRAYSFSKAFEKKVGEKPSSYLRQLRSVEN